jgi:NADPH:quinone reductase-like Zn-dependent oxidoreductase
LRQTKIVVTRYGGPEVITLAEQECPTPMPGEVRVKMLAAGVSLPDVLAREGIHPETPRVPYTPGWDLVGIVDQIGERVSGFESAILGWYILRNWFLPGRKSMVPYSIQWLMRLKPAWFRHDLLTLFDLLRQKKIEPLIAQRLPLCQARHAHELLGRGGVIGKIVLMPNG